MSKELEELIPDNPSDCLKALRKSANSYCSFNNAQCEYNKKLADNIEKALQRLEAIDNAKSSEALEIVRKYESSDYLNTWHTRFMEEFKTVKNYVLKAQENEQVLNKALKLNNEWAEELDYYKDLEEQIGCPLNVLFKALRDGLYDEYGNLYKGDEFYLNYNWLLSKPNDKYLSFNVINTYFEFKLTDYKKTWWLRKDKSE